MSLGLYIPRSSPIHALPASIKLLTLAIVSMVAFFIQDLGILTGLLGLTLLLSAIAQLPARAILAQLRPLLPVLMALFLVHGLLTSWSAGLGVMLRFVLLIWLAGLVTLTTRMIEMIDAIEQGLQPFARLGIRPGQVSMMLAIAIRFVPVLLDQAKEIQAAQQARGLERSPIALLVPLLIKTLRLADDLTDALDARGYEGD